MSQKPLKTTPRGGLLVRVYFVVLVAILVTLAVSTLPGVRSQPGVVPLYDDWLQSAGYVLAAGAVLWRVTGYAEQRLLWSLIAFALVLRAAGFLHFIFVADRTPGYPSVTDLFWVLSALALLAALVLVTHRFAPRRFRTLGLDALVGALTAAAVSLLLLEGTIDRLTLPGAPSDVTATNLAYPLLDVAQLVVITTLASATHVRLPWATGTMSAGILAFAVVDSVFLFQVTTGTFRPGSFLMPLALAGAVAIAASAWLPYRERRAGDADGPAGLIVPVFLAIVCVVVVAFDAVRQVSATITLLASAGVVLGIVRAYLTFRGDRQESSATIAEKDDEIELFQVLVDGSDDFIAIASFDGRLSYLNPAGRRMVGLPDSVDIRKTMLSDYVLNSAAHNILAARPGLAERDTWRGDSELIHHQGGSPIHVTANTFVLHHPHTGTPWLLATVQRDVTALRAAQTGLQRLADERKVLLSRLIESQEVERARIAADVHDDSVQAMAAVDLRLGLLQRRASAADPEIRAAIREVQEVVGDATARLRLLLFDLDSPAQRADLATALDEATATILGDAVRWRIEGRPDVDLPETQRVIAYRMTKEALTNVGKHARASSVSVNIRAAGKGVEVAVTDDGIGFDPAAVNKHPGHRGLSDMRDRAAIVGGWVKLEQPAGGGTTVRIWVPSTEPA